MAAGRFVRLPRCHGGVRDQLPDAAYEARPFGPHDEGLIAAPGGGSYRQMESSIVPHT